MMTLRWLNILRLEYSSKVHRWWNLWVAQSCHLLGSSIYHWVSEQYSKIIKPDADSNPLDWWKSTGHFTKYGYSRFHTRTSLPDSGQQTINTPKVRHLYLQRPLWQLGTGQADYHSQFTPKKEMGKIIRIYTKYIQLINMSTYRSNNSIFKKPFLLFWYP